MSISTTNNNSALGAVLSLVVKEGWLDGANDLCSMERTCKAAKEVWCNDKDTWKYLAMRQWPHLIEVHGNDDGSTVKWKSFFSDPRLWLEASAAQVKAKQKWSEIIHFDSRCDNCGCQHCQYPECTHTLIESKFRFERKTPKEWCYDSSCFCEPCFEKLVDEEIIKEEDYIKKEGGTLFNIVVKEIAEAKTEQYWDEHCRKKRTPRYPDEGNTYYDPFFKCYIEFDSCEQSWQEAYGVNVDDVGVVVAYALIQKGCKTRYLQLDGLHSGPTSTSRLGQRGYRALALALSINTSVERIDFFQLYGETFCCYDDFSYAADSSNGLFLKALEHNKASCLVKLPKLCPCDFGPLTMEAWEKAKPGLVCGPKFEA